MPASDLEDVLYWNNDNENDGTNVVDESYSRYDRVRAQPTNNELRIMWLLAAIVTVCLSIGVGVIYMGIITSRKARKNPFNKYLLFLGLPDVFYSCLCAITCFMNYSQGSYTSWNMCQFQVFYLYFGASANSWLNAVIAYDVYRLLRSSSIRKRYFPPTDYQVYRNTMVCYCIAMLTGSMPIIASKLHWDDYFPTPGLQAGFACQATEQTTTSTITFWFILAPLLFIFPYMYVTYVFVDVV